ncbi:MAG: alcohol dehydrogenase catalytic domain-containing protein [Streptosporangiales bacterium]|nr:alcohol dehydrogenase catalytic domain-containing protein [Streptosporangiales bacterium]MBO0891897.1 alcohol dehydrogenase catalytic domain-containing protein [Acidothermales bacterium]
MRAVLVDGPGTIAVRDVPAPDASSRTVVRVERAGVCGTDVKIVSGKIPVAYPRVLGHEIVGSVAVAGTGSSLPVGTRVLVNPSSACGSCAVCRADRPHLCPDGALLGRDVDGGFADLLAVDDAYLHPIPPSVPDDDAALLQVLGTCVHAQAQVDVFPGQTAVVIGLGVSGLLHLQLLRARGVETIIGVTRSRAKRELATRLGAVAVASPEDAEGVVREVTDGRGVDLAVECVGKEETLRQAMLSACLGATVLVFGTTSPTADGMPTYEWYYRELAIINPRAARPRDYDRAIALTASGTVQLSALLSARFDLADARDAFAACNDSGQLKVVLEVTADR